MKAALVAFLWLLRPDYPKPVDDFLNDYARIVDEETAKRIRQVCGVIRREMGIPIVVVTVSSLSDWNASDWSVERYATNLYNEWGIGSADNNQGVLLFVAVKDRKLRIAVGQGFGTSFDGPARSIIDSAIVPRFKQGDYAGGVLAGTEGIAASLRAGPEADPSHGGESEKWTTRGTPVGAAVRGERGWGLGWIVILALGALVLGAIFSVFRGGSGAGFGGWGGLLLGGLGGFLGSLLYNSTRGGGSSGRSWGSSSSGGGGSSSRSWGGSSSWGGGTSSRGGGYSSGGGASGSW
jgi:uncharacterized protein